MTYTYKTKGTCSTNIELEVEDGIVRNIAFWGGCNGNLQGLSRLFFTLAFIYQQRGLHNLLLLLFGQSREILYVIRFILDGEFSCNEPTDRSDALLPVKYFKSSVHSPVEID